MHPVFDSLGGVRGLLLGIIVLEDVYDSHEVHFLPGSSCSLEETLRVRTCVCFLGYGSDLVRGKEIFDIQYVYLTAAGPPTRGSTLY